MLDLKKKSANQHAATHVAPDRSQPRHRPCHGDPLFRRPAGASSPARGIPFPDNCPWDAGPEDHIQVDLGDHADTTRAISEIRERLEGGALHALVNNAAISPKAAEGTRMGTMDTDIETWSHVFRVNFFAPIMMARGLIEELKATKGSVVNVTSIAGSRVHPFAGVAYATSKAALASLTREMASDFGRVGVRVNSIAPGEIDTSILSPGTEKIVDQQIPMHRLGTPDEVAKIIYVLCTETSILRERRRDPHQRRPARLASCGAGAILHPFRSTRGLSASPWDALPPRLRCTRNCGRLIRPPSFARSRSGSHSGSDTR